MQDAALEVPAKERKARIILLNSLGRRALGSIRGAEKKPSENMEEVEGSICSTQHVKSYRNSDETAQDRA